MCNLRRFDSVVAKEAHYPNKFWVYSFNPNVLLCFYISINVKRLANAQFHSHHEFKIQFFFSDSSQRMIVLFFSHVKQANIARYIF